MNAEYSIDELFRALRAEDAESFFSTRSFDLNVKGSQGRNLLHEAIAFDKLETGIALIQAGISLDVRDDNGQTPLHYAAILDKPRIAGELLKFGIDVNAIDNFGNIALWCAVLRPNMNWELIEQFVAAGANSLLVNNAGRSVLDFARQTNNKRLWLLCGGEEAAF